MPLSWADRTIGSLPPRVTGEVKGELVITCTGFLLNAAEVATRKNDRRRSSDAESAAAVDIQLSWWGDTANPSARCTTCSRVVDDQHAASVEGAVHDVVTAIAAHEDPMSLDQIPTPLSYALFTIQSDEHHASSYLRDAGSVVVILRKGGPTAGTVGKAAKAVSKGGDATAIIGVSRIPLGSVAEAGTPPYARHCSGRVPVHSLPPGPVADACVARKGGAPGKLGQVVGTLLYGIALRLSPLPLLTTVPSEHVPSPPPPSSPLPPQAGPLLASLHARLAVMASHGQGQGEGQGEGEAVQAKTPEEERGKAGSRRGPIGPLQLDADVAALLREPLGEARASEEEEGMPLVGLMDVTLPALPYETAPSLSSTAILHTSAMDVTLAHQAPLARHGGGDGNGSFEAAEADAVAVPSGKPPSRAPSPSPPDLWTSQGSGQGDAGARDNGRSWLAGIPRPNVSMSPGLANTVPSLTASDLAASSGPQYTGMSPDVAAVLARSCAVLASIDQALGTQVGAGASRPAPAHGYNASSLSMLQASLSAGSNVWDAAAVRERGRREHVGAGEGRGAYMDRIWGDVLPSSVAFPTVASGKEGKASQALVPLPLPAPAASAVDEAYACIVAAVDEMLLPVNDRGQVLSGAEVADRQALMAAGAISIPSDPLAPVLAQAASDHARLQVALGSAESALKLPGLVRLGDRLRGVAGRVTGISISVSAAVVHPAAAVAAAHEASGRLGGMALLAVEDAKARAAAEKTGTLSKGAAASGVQAAAEAIPMPSDAVRPPRVLPKQSLSALRDWCTTARWTVEYKLPASRAGGDSRQAGTASLVVAFSATPDQPKPDVVARLTKGTGITGIHGQTGASPVKGVSTPGRRRGSGLHSAMATPPPAPAAAPAASSGPISSTPADTAGLLASAVPPPSLSVPTGSAHDWESSLAVPVPLGHQRYEPLTFDDAGLSRWIGGSDVHATYTDGGRDEEGRGGACDEAAEVRLYVEPPAGSTAAAAAPSGQSTGVVRVLVGTSRIPLRSLLLSDDLCVETSLDLCHSYRRRAGGSAAGTPQKDKAALLSGGSFAPLESTDTVEGRRQAFLSQLSLEGPGRERVERMLTMRDGIGARMDREAEGAEKGAAVAPIVVSAHVATEHTVREVVARLRMRLSLQVSAARAVSDGASGARPDFLAELRALPVALPEHHRHVEEPTLPVQDRASTLTQHTGRPPSPRPAHPCALAQSQASIPPSLSLGDVTATRLAHLLVLAAQRPSSAHPTLLLALHHTSAISVRDAMLAYSARENRAGTARGSGMQARLLTVLARVRPPRSTVQSVVGEALDWPAATVRNVTGTRCVIQAEIVLPLRLPGDIREAERMALGLCADSTGVHPPTVVVELWGRVAIPASRDLPETCLLGSCSIPLGALGSALVAAVYSEDTAPTSTGHVCGDVTHPGSTSGLPCGTLAHTMLAGTAAQVASHVRRVTACRRIQRVWAYLLRTRAAKLASQAIAEAKAADVLASRPVTSPAKAMPGSEPPAPVSVFPVLSPPARTVDEAQVEEEGSSGSASGPRSISQEGVHAPATPPYKADIDLPSLQVRLLTSPSDAPGLWPQGVRHQFHVYVPGKASLDWGRMDGCAPSEEAGCFIAYSFPRVASASIHVLWWSALDAQRSTSSVHSLPLPLSADVRDALPCERVRDTVGLPFEVYACGDREDAGASGLARGNSLGTAVLPESALRQLVESAWKDAAVRAAQPDSVWSSLIPQWHETYRLTVHPDSLSDAPRAHLLMPLTIVLAYRAVPIGPEDRDSASGMGLDTSMAHALQAVQSGRSARDSARMQAAQEIARQADADAFAVHTALLRSLSIMDEAGIAGAEEGSLEASTMDTTTLIVPNGELLAGGEVSGPSDGGLLDAHAASLLDGADRALRSALLSLAGLGDKDAAGMGSVAGASEATSAALIGLAAMQSSVTPLRTALLRSAVQRSPEVLLDLEARPRASEVASMQSLQDVAHSSQPVTAPAVALAQSSRVPLSISSLLDTATVVVNIAALADVQATALLAAVCRDPASLPSAVLYVTYLWPLPPPSTHVTTHAVPVLPSGRPYAPDQDVICFTIGHSHTLRVPASPAYWNQLLSRGVCLRLCLRAHVHPGSPLPGLSSSMPSLIAPLAALSLDPSTDPVLAVASVPLLPLASSILGGRIHGWYDLRAEGSGAGLGAIKVSVEADGVPGVGLEGGGGRGMAAHAEEGVAQHVPSVHAAQVEAEAVCAPADTQAEGMPTTPVRHLPLPSLSLPTLSPALLERSGGVSGARQGDSFSHPELGAMMRELTGMQEQLKGREGRAQAAAAMAMMQDPGDAVISASLLLSDDDSSAFHADSSKSRDVSQSLQHSSILSACDSDGEGPAGRSGTLLEVVPEEHSASPYSSSPSSTEQKAVLEVQEEDMDSAPSLTVPDMPSDLLAPLAASPVKLGTESGRGTGMEAQLGLLSAESATDIMASMLPVDSAPVHEEVEEDGEGSSFYDGLGFEPGELDAVLAALEREEGTGLGQQASAAVPMPVPPPAPIIPTLQHVPTQAITDAEIDQAMQPVQAQVVSEAEIVAALATERGNASDASEEVSEGSAPGSSDSSRVSEETGASASEVSGEDGVAASVSVSVPASVTGWNAMVQEVDTWTAAVAGMERDRGAPRSTEPAPHAPAPMQLIQVSLPGIGLVYLPVVMVQGQGLGQGAHALPWTGQTAGHTTPAQPPPVPVPTLAPTPHAPIEDVYTRLRSKLGLAGASERESEGEAGEGGSIGAPGGSPPDYVSRPASGLSSMLSTPARGSTSGASAGVRQRPAPRAFSGAHDPAKFAALLRGAAAGTVAAGLVPAPSIRSSRRQPVGM